VTSRVAHFQVWTDSFSTNTSSCIQEKVKVSCHLHATKACGGVEEQLRPFLNIVLDGKDWTVAVLSPWNENPISSDEESRGVSEPI